MKKIVTSFGIGVALIAGVFTAFAAWPISPEGESTGGWLGEIFDLDASESGTLVVKSDKVGVGTTTPTAKLEINGNVIANTPTQNNHLTTKSYVDALGGAANTSGGGGGVFVLTTSSSTPPSCPAGYISALNGYYIMPYIDGGYNRGMAFGEAFCHAQPKIQMYRNDHSVYTFSSQNNISRPRPNYVYGASYNRCAVCVKDSATFSQGKKIFVTSVGYNGNLGGEAGADEKCQARASAAKLDGTYKAWLLDGTNEKYIYKKFEDTTYVNMRGQVVITTFLNYNQYSLAWQELENQINYDEFGRSVSPLYRSKIWTGLDLGGENAESDCDNFSDKAPVGVVGTIENKNTYSWYHDDKAPNLSCTVRARLICVET